MKFDARPSPILLAGGMISQYVSPKLLNYLAGAGFIGIGVWTLLRA